VGRARVAMAALWGSLISFQNCHPERSMPIREAVRHTQSKDPCTSSPARQPYGVLAPTPWPHALQNPLAFPPQQVIQRTPTMRGSCRSHAMALLCSPRKVHVGTAALGCPAAQLHRAAFL
jgi:hypothetical protein